MTQPDDQDQRPGLFSRINPRKAAYIGAGVGIPAATYTAGLMHQGVPLGSVPQAAWGDLRALGTHQVGPNKVLQGSLGAIGSTMRTGTGAILRGSGRSIKSGAHATGQNVKNLYKGIFGLSARLDDLIEFGKIPKLSAKAGFDRSYGRIPDSPIPMGIGAPMKSAKGRWSTLLGVKRPGLKGYYGVGVTRTKSTGHVVREDIGKISKSWPELKKALDRRERFGEFSLRLDDIINFKAK